MTKHILIVDDEPNFCLGAGIALKKAGYEISKAGDGEEALKMILKNNHFDLLIIDIFMPKMSGIELIGKLRENNVSTPIVAISSFIDNTVVDELISRGCSEFLDKPFEPREFIKRVNKLLKAT